MLEFIVGYVLGSGSKNTAPIKRKTVAIFMLVLLAFAGGCYMIVPILFPESSLSSAEQCGGIPLAAMMCNLKDLAKAIGVALVGVVALTVAVWCLIASVGSSKK